MISVLAPIKLESLKLKKLIDVLCCNLISLGLISVQLDSSTPSLLSTEETAACFYSVFFQVGFSFFSSF